MIASLFSNSENQQGSGNYTTLWVTALDNYMHECRAVGDDWVRLRRALESKSESKKKSLIRQFLDKNVAEPFVRTFGTGAFSADQLIPTESLDALADILVTRLDPEELRYV